MDYTGTSARPSFFFYPKCFFCSFRPYSVLRSISEFTFESCALAVAKPFSGHFARFKHCRLSPAKKTVISFGAYRASITSIVTDRLSQSGELRNPAYQMRNHLRCVFTHVIRVLFPSRGRTFVRIRKAVDVGLFPFRTLWNGACQFSSFVFAGMVPTIFLPGWLLFPFTRVLCESAGRDIGRGVCSVLLPLLLLYGTSPFTSQSSVTRTFRQGPLRSPPCLANVLNG